MARLGQIVNHTIIAEEDDEGKQEVDDWNRHPRERQENSREVDLGHERSVRDETAARQRDRRQRSTSRGAGPST